MDKKLKKLKDKYGAYLYDKGMEILGRAPNEPEELAIIIDEYILSEEFLAMLHEEYRKHSSSDEVFEIFLGIKDLKYKRCFALLLAKILEIS